MENSFCPLKTKREQREAGEEVDSILKEQREKESAEYEKISKSQTALSAILQNDGTLASEIVEPFWFHSKVNSDGAPTEATGEYISKKDKIGTTANTHKGKEPRLLPETTKGGLKPKGWVKMHLLPHRLGGNAVSDNLVPARSNETNLTFSGNIEQQAIKLKNELNATVAKEKGVLPGAIWYSATVEYGKTDRSGWCQHESERDHWRSSVESG